MSFRSVVANVPMAGVTLAGLALVLFSLTNESFIRAQSPQTAAPPNFRLPDESTGIDEIARTLVSAFDQVDIVALGETHRWRLDTDLRIAVVRHPDFAKKVRSIVVEFGSTTEQSTLDRYIRGEDVSRPNSRRSGRPQLRRPTASGTDRFTRSFSQPSATSIRGCLPMREFASLGVIPDRETTVAVRPRPSPF